MYQGGDVWGGDVRLRRGAAELHARHLTVDIRLNEVPGVETVCRHGESYAWTRKQAPVRADAAIELEGVKHSFEGWAVIDDTAAYYPRHTRWWWSAGIGRTSDGHGVAWNLVSGINDPLEHSERTVWVDGAPSEVAPCSFSDDLRSLDELRFAPEATLERRQNLLIVRSDYRQPFGTFEGSLPGGIELAEAYGVMEEHEAWW